MQDFFSNIGSLAIAIAFFAGLAIDGIALLLAVYFILEDRIKRPGNPKNGGSWLPAATLFLCGWVGGSYYLYHQDHKVMAAIIAWIPAFPVLIYGLFVRMFMVLKPDMK